MLQPDAGNRPLEPGRKLLVGAEGIEPPTLSV